MVMDNNMRAYGDNNFNREEIDNGKVEGSARESEEKTETTQIKEGD